jgi:1,2-phenylacetyl-CoA epoxidase catalytic subunit
MKINELHQLINDELRITEENLDKCMLEQGALFASYAVRLATLRAEYDRKKAELQTLEATLGKEYREKLTKVTEKAVEEAVTSDERWKQANEELINAKEDMLVIEAIVDALIQKKEMLVAYTNLMKTRSFQGERNGS